MINPSFFPFAFTPNSCLFQLIKSTSFVPKFSSYFSLVSWYHSCNMDPHHDYQPMTLIVHHQLSVCYQVYIVFNYRISHHWLFTTIIFTNFFNVQFIMPLAVMTIGWSNIKELSYFTPWITLKISIQSCNCKIISSYDQ